jgi:glucosyl-3-phosphoglycerate synthase
LGLLIDATMKGVRTMEVDIGHLRHESQSLEALGMMARQVVRTLLDRARRHGRLTGRHMEEVEEVERHTALELEFQAKSNSGSRGIALFDMDGTLVRGRTAIAAAERHGNLSEIEGLLSCPATDTAEQATRVAVAFRGLRRTDLEGVARDLPLVDGAVETIRVLRKAGYLVGIVTDSYRIAAEIVRRRVFADFSVANLLRFSDGRATGEVTLSPLFANTDGCREHTWCKGNALRHLSERYEIPTSRFLAVGDNSNDLCMLRLAGMPFAFEPKCQELAEAGTVVSGNLRGVLRATRSLFAVA